MLSPKKGIFLETIITCEEASLNLLKSCLSFGEVWRVLMKKNWEATERRGSIVKFGKCCLTGACENPVGVSICDGPMEIVFVKRWSPMRGELGWDRVAYWLQRCQWLLLSLLSSWSHHYGLC